MIKLNNIRKTYYTGELEFEALKGIDVHIKKGEFVSIIGPSGSGKSTLMNIIGCLDVATEGSYLLSQEDVSRIDDFGLSKVRNRKIGFVFQSFNLIPRMSALQNVALPLVYAGVSFEERIKRATYALNIVGLGDKLKNKPNEMSGGQKQRVAIARAIVTEPDVILADEPTGNLDSKTTQEIMNILAGLKRKGNTIVLITHEPEIAEQTERVLVIKDGLLEKDYRNSHTEVGESWVS